MDIEDMILGEPRLTAPKNQLDSENSFPGNHE